MNIRVHIERLVLEGFPIGHNHPPIIQAAVEAKLMRLLEEGGLHSSLRTGIALPAVAGGTMRMPERAEPGPLGTAIGQAIYKGIGRGE